MTMATVVLLEAAHIPQNLASDLERLRQVTVYMLKYNFTILCITSTLFITYIAIVYNNFDNVYNFNIVYNTSIIFITSILLIIASMSFLTSTNYETQAVNSLHKS